VKDNGQAEKGSDVKAPGTGELDLRAKDQGENDSVQGGAGDPENLKRAAELQLENIRDLVKQHPDLLDKARMTPEELDRYYAAKQRQIDAYARQSREKTEAAAKEPNPPTKSSDSLSNLSAKPLKPDDAKTGTANKPGAGAPPPEFRDMYYKRFTQPSKGP
jgi:hypothetical protein